MKIISEKENERKKLLTALNTLREREMDRLNEDIAVLSKEVSFQVLITDVCISFFGTSSDPHCMYVQNHRVPSSQSETDRENDMLLGVNRASKPRPKLSRLSLTK